jgi:hypothetical protein
LTLLNVLLLQRPRLVMWVEIDFRIRRSWLTWRRKIWSKMLERLLGWMSSGQNFSVSLKVLLKSSNFWIYKASHLKPIRYVLELWLLFSGWKVKKIYRKLSWISTVNYISSTNCFVSDFLVLESSQLAFERKKPLANF